MNMVTHLWLMVLALLFIVHAGAAHMGGSRLEATVFTVQALLVIALGFYVGATTPVP